MTLAPRSSPAEPAPGLAAALGDGGELARRVRTWIAEDPDPRCQGELRALLERGRWTDLAERFGSELRFGTAGLRGPLGAGPSRMNRATVRRTTAGLAAFLLRDVPAAASAGVVIAHDARHGSAAFAEEAARVLTGAGVRALRLPGEVATPVLAFSVCELGCAGGVMVTASHNPPGDNGYKVYLGDGAQIAPPVDERIAECIERVGPLPKVPLGSAGEMLDDTITGAYVRAIVAALPSAAATPEGDPPLRILYTPLHGVGRGVLLAAFARAGFPRPLVVPEQADPDPDFPTIARPNPEEPGTLGLALTEAARQRADLVLANDPDADRLAVAIPVRGETADGWRMLTGDEVGALLARHLLARCADRERALVITTVASSTLLERMAQDAGVAYRQTLTGFKWIMRAAAEERPRRLLLGYEEALGYAVNDVVHDKDGISAALVMCQLAAQARREATTPAAYLDELACRYGLYATRQLSLELSGRGPEAAAQLMRRVRKRPPRRLGAEALTELEDLLGGERLPASDVVVMGTAQGTRVVIRPSGTEPKLKAYLQVVLAVAGGDVSDARRRAARRLDALAEELRGLLRP